MGGNENPNPAFIQTPVYILPYGLADTASGSQPPADANVPAGLVTAPAFGYYRLVGMPVNNQIKVDPEPTPVGK